MNTFLMSAQSFFSVYGEVWWPWSAAMSRALLVTLQIAVLSFVLSLAIGLLVSIARISRSVILSRIALAYVEVSRGVPALVILFLIYYGLVPLGVVVDAVTAAIVGLALSAGGYVAEIFRAGIQATHRGQREAALTVGMTSPQIYRYILVPQAVRIVMPPLVNTLIALLKDSSLASLIAAPEIMLRAKDISSSTFLPLHIFVWAGAMYFFMALPLSLLAGTIQRRMNSGLR